MIICIFTDVSVKICGGEGTQGQFVLILEHQHFRLTTLLVPFPKGSVSWGSRVGKRQIFCEPTLDPGYRAITSPLATELFPSSCGVVGDRDHYTVYTFPTPLHHTLVLMFLELTQCWETSRLRETSVVGSQ